MSQFVTALAVPARAGAIVVLMSEAFRTHSQPAHVPPSAEADQRVRLHGVSWRDYETVLAIRGDDAGVRLTYLRGELEFMRPSWRHGLIQKTIARLVEIYALERDIELEGAGSWTVKEELQERGAEPDECYFLRRPDGAQPERPDLALEVVHTSGGLDKLEVYRGLGVPEVWFWREGRLEVHLLEGGAYVSSPTSRLLPDLDLDLLLRHLDPEHQSRATRNYLAALRQG
jgi:Uma2 family endonuclease